MSVSTTTSAIGILLAAVVSVGALLLATPVGDLLPVSPFGWQRIVVVHCLSTLPLAWVIAASLPPAPSVRSSRFRSLVWFGVGVLVALSTIGLGFTMDRFLARERVGFTGRLVVRAVWCLVLQVPWLAAAGVRFARPAIGNVPGPGASLGVARTLGLLGALTGCGIPAAYLAQFVATQTERAEQLCRKPRLRSAEQLLRRLVAVGSGRPVAVVAFSSGRVARLAPARALDFQRQQAQQVAAAVDALQAVWQQNSLDNDSRLNLARLLATLENMADARRVLAPIASTDPRAAFLLAQLLQDAKAWRESSRWFETSLRLAHAGGTGQQEDRDIAGGSGQSSARAGASGRLSHPVRQTTGRDEKLLSDAYDALAYNARELKQYDQAEQIYFRAMEKLPTRQAYFHHQLARHYKLAGRTLAAQQQEREAHRLNPGMYERPVGVGLVAGLLVLVILYILLIQDQLIR